jgi:hypothetical protein
MGSGGATLGLRLDVGWVTGERGASSKGSDADMGAAEIVAASEHCSLACLQEE